MTKHPNSIDVYVGGRVKFRRKQLGLSLRAVAEKLGLSFQQMQKHEKGVDRIRVSRLYALAAILDVPLTFFFDGVELTQRLERIPDRRAREAFRALIRTTNKACAPTNSSGPEE